MGGQINSYSYLFGPFRLDPAERLLLRDGQPVSLAPKEFDTLRVLVENAGHLAAKEELIAKVWPGSFVGDGSLARNISVLRKTLGEDSIETIPTKGYRFITPVQRIRKEFPEPAPDSELTSLPESPIQAAPGEEVRAKDRPVEATRGGRRRIWPTALILLVLAVALGYFGVRRFSRPVPARPAQVVLAVLPFVNLTGDEKQEYFCDGLTEEMIGTLSRQHPGQLLVIARTTAMKYKDSKKSVAEIGGELGVDYVLESSVRRSGERLRISAQLIRAPDQIHLWSREYDRPNGDILEVQQEIASAIGHEFRLQAVPNAQARAEPATSPAAYDNYLRGRFLWNQRTPEALQKGIEYFQHAIALDPQYAWAYAGLVDSYAVFGGYGMPPREAYPRADAAARRALELNPSLAEAHATLGYLMYIHQREWEGAEREFQRALTLDPGYATAHHWYAIYLAAMRRLPEALSHIRKALELDPLSPAANANLGMILARARRYDEAVTQLEKTVRMEHTPGASYSYLIMTSCMQGNYDDAIAWAQRYEREGGRKTTLAPLVKAFAHARTGHSTEALREVQELEERGQHELVSPGLIAFIYAALGETDLAFTWLQRAIDAGETTVMEINNDPALDPLRSDPRFAAIRRQFHLPD